MPNRNAIAVTILISSKTIYVSQRMIGSRRVKLI